MDVNNLPVKFIETLDMILKCEGYLKRDIKILPLSKNIVNYMSIANQINIKGTTKDETKEIKLFIKRPIRNAGNIISMKKAFGSEAFFYNDLSKIYDDLQNEANIPGNDRYSVVKSYGCNLDVIALQNLIYEGYQTFDVTEVVPLEFAELSMVQLAKLHALSFALEIKRPDYFLEKDISNKRMPWIFGAEWKPYIKSISAITVKLLDGDYKKKIESILPTLDEVFERIMLPDENICCLCHGDYRTSNILATVSNGKPTKTIAIDYQHIHYSSPVTDILIFMTLGTDLKFRNAHLNYLKDLYYKTMTKFLKHFNLDVNTIYPRDEFEKAYKNKSFLSIILVIASMPFAYFENENRPDFEDIENYSLKLKPSFAVKAKEFIQEYFHL